MTPRMNLPPSAMFPEQRKHRLVVVQMPDPKPTDPAPQPAPAPEADQILAKMQDYMELMAS